MPDTHSRQVVVIGGGQSGLAVGYFLRRAGLDFEILDANPQPGGAWPSAWDSLHLFSPAQWSSLPVRRPVRVKAVEPAGERLLVRTDAGSWTASAVVSATGGASRPFVPDYPGRDTFRGRQLHSSSYRAPGEFAGQRVLVLGGGNSGAQIMAELSQVAEATWVTSEPPTFLPDDVDGRVLFERATERVRAQQAGRDPAPPLGGLGDIVMVPTVREARDRGVLRSVRPFLRFEPDGVVWQDGSRSPVDAVVWCTGFRPALDHLAPLGVLEPDGRIAVQDGRSIREPRLWLVGYGDWTGVASATLAGVTRAARGAVQEIQEALAGAPPATAA